MEHPAGPLQETELLNEALERAQRIVAERGHRPALIEQARQQGERVLGSFFEVLGWQVMVKWQDRPMPVPRQGAPSIQPARTERRPMGAAF